MAFWTEPFMNKMRNEWLRRIQKVQYQAGGRWYDAQITDKHIEGDTMYVTTATTDSANLTISAIRILDTSGETAGQTNESIVKASDQGVITLWEFPLYEIPAK